MQESERGLKFLLKVDSIYKDNPSIILYARDTYSLLNYYYKDQKNQKNQIKYLTKLITVDSLIKVKYGDLDNEIIKKYDTSNLISEKEDLIKFLKKEKNTSQKTTLAFIIISVLAFSFTFYFLRKNYILKKRFQSVIEQINGSKKSKENLLKVESTGISKDLTEKILKGLEKFEKSQRFLKKKYTLNSLAKELNTNSTYLSKVINLEKDTNFANYLNNLKIDYAINRLSNDKQFRLYTIKAISEESGFNNQLTFSIAFHKKTKLQPSYFIKQLKNT